VRSGPDVALTILHLNDLHGGFGPERAAVVQALRDENPAGTLVVDCGDAIRAGNLAIPLRPEAVWADLAAAGVEVGTLGNRESHVMESVFRRKLEGASHALLVANLFHRDGSRPLPDRLILERAGLRIGLVGAMVPMVTERMATAAASAYRWTPPIPAIAAVAQELRSEVDVVIALTHIGHRQDRALAEAVPELDWILGGHSHTVLAHPERVGRVWIAQTGSHGRFVGRYRWSPSEGLLEAELVPLPAPRKP